MTKEELIHVVNDSLSIVDITIQQCDILLDDETPDKKEVRDSLSIINRFISQINNDIKYDLIPSFYYPKISVYLNELGLTDLPYKGVYPENFETQIHKQSFISTLKQPSITNAVSKLHSYDVLKSLRFIISNTVIVGANGSGKTTLADTLINGMSEKIGIVIPSQKLLIVPTLQSIPNYSLTNSEYDKFQKNVRNDKITYNSNKGDELPYNESKLYISEFNIILRNLIAERASINNSYCENIKQGLAPREEDLGCTLDKAIIIWNSLIEHRKMFCDENNNLSIKTIDTEKEDIYPAYLMSDGEKVILYLIARVLMTSNEGLIIVDEPELYLHRAIVDKLWNQLELERTDCIFIYLTHDLDFASNRNANKFWIKSFKHPLLWEIESIPDNSIPENLLMELLGSRKPILFCEGDSSERSLDIPIYEVLFPNYTIRPVRTCKDVINYTKAFNKIPNNNLIAYGIIDRDFRTTTQLTKLEDENVFSFTVAEIENLFLVEEFIEAFVKYKKEECDLEALKKEIIYKLKTDKKLQTSNFVSSKINYHYKESHIKKGNSKEELLSSFEAFNNDIKINNWYLERIEEIDDIVQSNNYDKAIMIYNNKGLHTVVEKILGYKSSEYRSKALLFLQNSDSAKQILRNKFPPEIINHSTID
ncbi:MAG TPA: AAA family ATPase [Edaphocola sp.]|nr:AAA family ATPase [Edaphocola sp.]